jgi:hypothetical protein
MSIKQRKKIREKKVVASIVEYETCRGRRAYRPMFE